MEDKRLVNALPIGFFYGLGIMMMAYAFVADSPQAIMAGMQEILVAPSNLLTDYMQVGGVGAAYFNAGALLVISALGVHMSGARVTGAVTAAMITVAGFSFFGKNLVNSFPIPLGVYLYARVQRIPFRNLAYIALFGMGLAPIVSMMIFGVGLQLPFGIIFGVLAGLGVGFILTPLSTQFLNFHQGFNLYNVGFTVGIIGMAFVGFVRMFAIEVVPIRHVYEGNDRLNLIFLLLLFGAMVIYGLLKNQGLKEYRKLLRQSGRLVSDFVVEYPVPLIILNMGLLGLLSVVYVKASNGSINGPIMGAIFTVVGFGGFGKHPRNVLPILLGVYVTSALNIYDPAGTESVLTGLFATTIAPIAGHFGFIAGFIAASIHDAMAMNIGFIHGGLNLYNNGLSGGFVAAVTVPIFQFLSERFGRHEE